MACPFSIAGQNESGVAVHDDRIYVVGGYSIWTNEPLACIQVSRFGPKRLPCGKIRMLY